MPCYLFTYHAYGTWMPDRSRGYVKRSRGILPRDDQMAELYRRSMKEQAVSFDDQLQRWSIAALLESEPLQLFELYFVATDATHLHVLLGWRNDRGAVALRSLVKGSLSRALNRAVKHRIWFADGGSRKQVKSGGHFAYLTTSYLPKHAGWKWSRERGYFK